MHSRLTRRAAAIWFVLLIAAAAFCLETQVIPATDLQKRVRMTSVSIEPVFSNKPVRTPDFLVTMDEDSVLVRGRDRSGKPWRAVLPAALRGLWRTESKGLRNYYFAGYTGGAGMAPDTWILILSFDDQARPVPFYITSYAAYDSKGIRDLLDLDGTGPQLLQQTWVETHWMPDTRSGYYITALYQQRGLYWYRADGRHGARTFPLFEKWVLPLPETRPQLTVVPDSSNWVADYGNDPRAGVRTKVASVDKHGFHVVPELGCHLESVGLVIQDSEAGRQIHLGHYFPNSPLLRGIVRAGASLTFAGLDPWPGADRCSASAVWAGVE
jgi:hypothetical protein